MKLVPPPARLRNSSKTRSVQIILTPAAPGNSQKPVPSKSKAAAAVARNKSAVLVVFSLPFSISQVEPSNSGLWHGILGAGGGRCNGYQRICTISK